MRTFHNDTADYGTRADAEEVHTQMAAKGLAQLDVVEAWGDLMRNGVQRRVLRVLGQDAETSVLALQLREARLARRFKEVVEVKAPGAAL